MKCPTCGAENEKGAVFCYQCGSALAATVTPSATGPTVALNPADVEALERTAQPGITPAVQAAPTTTRQSSTTRVYQVPDSSPPAYRVPESNAPIYNTTMVGAPSRTSSMAIVALVLGIISFMGIFLIGGIGAIATGHLARREIRASGGQVGGDGLATAGLVLGYLNVLLSILGIIGFCLLVLGAGISAGP